MREPNRFDNIPTADLEARELETRLELKELREAVRLRLIAEASERIIVGKVYRVTSGRFEGRKILVSGINSGTYYASDADPYRTFAWGRLNGKSAAGDGWTIKQQQVDVKRLEPIEE